MGEANGKKSCIPLNVTLLLTFVLLEENHHTEEKNEIFRFLSGSIFQPKR